MEQRNGVAGSDLGQSTTSYPFLNHSAMTIPNKLPPDVDNKPLARQKRKRTSPEDQAVLEAAYQQDPKPDKEARLRLISTIALSEKEIQIWFQNRRQTSRRKSRPLLPHEIAQFHLSKYEPASSGSTDSACTSNSHDGEYSSDPVCESSQGPNVAADRPSSIDIPSLIDPRIGRSLSVSSPLQLTVQSDVEKSTARRSLPSLHHILNTTLTYSLPADNKLQRSSSSSSSSSSSPTVRLSMTSEGRAQINTKSGLTPPPPQPSKHPAQHSMQPLPPIHLPEKSSQPTSLKRSASGRSRDSRAWEFWCDKDCRSELELKAEKDGKGSAADAIGFIRATSNRKVLQPLSVRQNSPMLPQQPWQHKRNNIMSKRPVLQRAHTSNGRLQQQHSSVMTSVNKRRPLPKISVLETDCSVYIPGNESDKENWSPNNSSRKTDEKLPLPRTKMDASKSVGQENCRPENDEEIASFMHGSSSSVLSETEELDCVQGLLSLSQGRWVS